ncbi:hypothetical protein QA584_05315 [Anaerocolumna sp. AGMB13025]|uniref:hypothetical protein n=1 Tax=Anaerocolumna sp. AGMB13025 TaxID=3039116 RepID=UPI00241DD80D|nr:hypothetical protein [Anaerocolumna sp. AGMB13025]WFR58492.1 hypothetical protein QA584_05315 [Anaerocolumna sp. AGMB13025]
MQDTILLNKISEEVQILSKNNNFNKVNKLLVCVNADSKVNEENLYNHLHHANKKLVGVWTKISVERDELPDQVAILKNIEGDITLN